MAAVRYWTGATDGDWETTTNWAGGTVPVATDTAIFNTGSQDVTGENLDQSDVALARLVITSGYTGNLGGSGTPLIVDVDEIDFAGQGTGNYIQLKGEAACNCIITVIDTASNDNALHIDTDTNGTIKSLTVRKGTVTVDGSAAFSTTAGEGIITVGYASTESTDATVTIGTSVTGIQTINQYGGTLTNGSAVTQETGTYNVFAGTATHTDGNIDAVNVYGGTFEWDGAGDTITLLKIFRGIFDGSGASMSGTDVPIITNTYLHQGGTLNVNNDERNVAFTDGIVCLCPSPTIQLDEGTKLSVTHDFGKGGK